LRCTKARQRIRGVA